jgi:uncharacterized membrane protein
MTPIEIGAVVGVLIGFLLGIVNIILKTKELKCEDAGFNLLAFVLISIILGTLWFIVIPVILIYAFGTTLSYFCKKIVIRRHKNASRSEEIREVEEGSGVSQTAEG